MERLEQLQAAARIMKAREKLAAEEAKAMTEATERVKLRYAEKRDKLLDGVPAEVLELLGVGDE